MNRARKLFGKYCGYFVFLAFIVATPAEAVLVFSAAPGSESSEGPQAYAPLIEYLAKVIGEPVIYEKPKGWAEYSEKMRNGEYDIVFDAPHFTSWRIKNISHEPVARLPGKLGYTLLVNRQSTTLNSLRDLVGVKICALGSPHLGTMTVYSLFTNPVFMPQIHEIQGEFKDVYSALRSAKCEAAVVRDMDYIHLIPAEKNEVKVIARSAAMPMHTITISHRLLEKKMLITNMLVSAQGAKAAANILALYGNRGQSLIRVNKDEYRGLYHLLTDVVWGW